MNAQNNQQAEKEVDLPGMLAFAGYTPQSAAQMMANNGMGNAGELQRALETKDMKFFESFVPAMAKELKEKHPTLFNFALGMAQRFFRS